VPKASKFNFETVCQSVRKAILSRAKTKLKTCTLSADKIKPQRKKQLTLTYTVSLAAIFRRASSAHTQAKNKSLIFTHVHSRLCVSDINKSQHSRNKTLNNTSAHTGIQDLMTDMQPLCTKQESFTNTVSVALIYANV